jgi:hypothetical protein
VSGGTVTDTEWFVGGDGDWTDGANWDAGVPGPWSQAQLGSGTYTVSVSTDQTVYGISTDFGATLEINGGAFWTNGGTGTGQNFGTIEVQSGSFNVSGYFRNAGQLRATDADAILGLHAAYVEGGVIDLGVGAALQSGGFDSVLVEVTVVGQVDALGSSAVHASSGGSLTVLGGQILFGTLIADGAAGDGSFADSTIAFGDTVLQEVSLTGAGRYETLVSTFTFLQDVTVAAGTVLDVVAGSTVNVQDTFTTDGTTNVGDAGGGATMTFFGDGRLNGSGTLRLEDGIIDTCGCSAATIVNNTLILGSGRIGNADSRLVNIGEIVASGDLFMDTGSQNIVNRGTMEGGVDGTLIPQSRLVNEGLLRAVGALELGRAVNRATIDNADGGTVTASDTLTNQLAGILTNRGEYDQNATVANYGLIQNLDGTFSVDGNFSNMGSVEVDGGSWEVLGRTVNRSTITTGAGSEVTHADVLKNLAGATLTSGDSYTVDASLSNGGLIECVAGDFTVTGRAVNSGSITVADGASFTVAGEYNGRGSLIVEGGSLSVGSRAVGGTVSLSDGGVVEYGGAARADVTFAADANTLLLGESTAFRGALHNFVDGNLVGFLDMPSSDAVYFTYQANAEDTGGLLRVIDKTAGLFARLQIDGAGYTTADFVASSYIAPDSSSHFAVLSAHPAA